MKTIVRSLVTALVAVLLTLPLLALSTSPAGAAAAPDDTPGYAIKRFHVRTDDNPRLARQWRVWREREVRRYTTVVERSCFCIPQRPIRTVVRRGEVTSVTHEGRRRELRRHGYEMDAIYRVLRSAYRRADDVQVSYRHGVPVRVYIDYIRLAADDELGLTVSLRAS